MTLNGGTEITASSGTLGVRSSGGVSTDRVRHREEHRLQVDLGEFGADRLAAAAELVGGHAPEHEEAILGLVEDVGDPSLSRDQRCRG